MQIITPYQVQALNIEKHISLVANAGSGKTFVLAKRFVEIFLKQDIQIEDIIAITFTDKAAKELYKKISEEISERLTEANDDFEKLDQLRRQLPSANISTIHSFCSRVLKNFAPEAGIDVNFSLLNGSEMDELFELTVDEYISKNLVGSEISEDLKLLIRIIGSKDNLTAQIKKIFDKRDTMILLSNELYIYDYKTVSEIIKDRFIHQFKSVFKNDLNALFDSIKEINNQVLIADSKNIVALKISALLSKKTEQDFIEDLSLLFEVLEAFVVKAGTIRKSGYLSKVKGFDLTPHVNIESSIQDLLDSKLNRESFELLQFSAKFGITVSKIVRKIFDLYQTKKRKKSLLDYEDLLLFTKELFAKEEVLSMLKEKYKFIMIDEYQDTNDIQYQIFVPLLDELKRGNLFVVGDEKQSIYMFRNADLSVFRKTNELIKSKNEKESILTLPHSFRLYPAIAGFTNKLFSCLFFSPNPEYNEVAYESLICTKPVNDLGEIQLLIEKKNENSMDDDSEEQIQENKEEQLNQYELVALKIIELINSTPEVDRIKLSEIAILSRKRSAFEPIESALIKHKISYQIVKGTGFYQKQVVYDLYNYFAFLLNQSDDIALIGVLKSPFFNFKDIDLLEIVSYAGSNIFEKLKNYSLADDTKKSTVNKLKSSISKVNELSIHELMMDIVLDSDYLAIISSREQSQQDLANINKLIQKSRDYTNLGFKTIYDYVQFLKESITKIDDEGQGEVELDKEKVSIMTIHSSKGLEFKAVFVVECESSFINTNDNRKGVIDIASNFGYMSHLPKRGNYFDGFERPPQLCLSDFIQKKKEIAEAKRLFYVAVTRAMKYLYLTANDNKNSSTSFLGLLKETFDLEGRDIINIDSELDFMFMNENEEYYIEKHAISFSIPIINTIEKQELKKTNDIKEKKNLFIDKDLSSDEYPKNEFYSATKIAVFSQCPIKYHLIYDLGFNKINEIFQKTDFQYEFKDREDDEFLIPSDMRGRIIHKILELNITTESLRDVIKAEIQNELIDHPNALIDISIEQIFSTIMNYYSSSVYQEINSFVLFKNEYELYYKFYEDYLYGVIDKVIVDENEKVIHIIDYKTDKLNYPMQAEEKFQNYLVQLYFYAFLLSKKYEGYTKFKLRIVFVEKPELEFIHEVDSKGLNKFSSYLEEVIKKIKFKEVNQEKGHCSKCHFYTHDKCIMDK
ncbi:MAG: UvrD-helicase domain-containing protein [Melioribacteraceae bacterium]|nr:UvrD-helicase domain-containing protein [Melioribacteraceae bacterium]